MHSIGLTRVEPDPKGLSKAALGYAFAGHFRVTYELCTGGSLGRGMRPPGPPWRTPGGVTSAPRVVMSLARQNPGNLRMCQNAVLAHFERDLTLCSRTQFERSLNAQTASRTRPNIL